ncbi:hypothetical protein [Aeromonas rivipollensis]|uniref:hypothetical protein n=1 Tax=Aeromonas rivipollensis TaxID=948519 RepID=UPI003D1CFF26
MLQTLLVFGEGPTDLGASRNAQAYAYGDDLEVGPMLRLAHRLLVHHLPDWNADLFDLQQEHAIPSVLVAAAEMKTLAKASPFRFPSKRTKSGNLIHGKRAEVLGKLAQQTETPTQHSWRFIFTIQMVLRESVTIRRIWCRQCKKASAPQVLWVRVLPWCRNRPRRLG